MTQDAAGMLGATRGIPAEHNPAADGSFGDSGRGGRGFAQTFAGGQQSRARATKVLATRETSRFGPECPAWCAEAPSRPSIRRTGSETRKHSCREAVPAVLSLLPVDFDRLWVLALSGHLKFASLTFTPPKFRSALLVNMSFSSEREE